MILKHFTPYSQFCIYATEQRVYVTAQDEAERDGYRLLRFERHREELRVTEDPTLYTNSQRLEILARLRNGNLGFRVLAENCPALIGCIRFTGCYYLMVVTRSRHAGRLCCADVYGIESTKLIPLGPIHSRIGEGSGHGTMEQMQESKARRLLGMVSLSRDFFFSHVWPLWSTLQDFVIKGESTMFPFRNDRVWNNFLSQPLRSELGYQEEMGQMCRWVTPLIHGSFRQQSALVNRVPVTITIIARRSRFHAGTRFLCRGIDANGHVANDCDVEQIVEVASGRSSIDTKSIWKAGSSQLMQPSHAGIRLPVAFSSVIQNRGSVPLFWTQDWFNGQPGSEGSLASPLRPAPIRLRHIDPFYNATKKHFDDLRRRFGEPIFCLDLMKKSSKKRYEAALSSAYENGVSELNRTSGVSSNCKNKKLEYVSFDLRQAQKSRGSKLLGNLQKFQAPMLASTGIFVASTDRRAQSCPEAIAVGHGDSDLRVTKVQSGIVRTNCLDCLDRTNVGQFSFALLALGEQLCSLGLIHNPAIDAQSTLAKLLMELWEVVGHQLAEQYAGSEAQTSFFRRARGEWQPAWQSRNFLTAIRRLYSTIATDEEKQTAINLFLGYADVFSGLTVGNSHWRDWTFLSQDSTAITPTVRFIEGQSQNRQEQILPKSWSDSEEGEKIPVSLQTELSSASLSSSIADDASNFALHNLLQDVSDEKDDSSSKCDKNILVGDFKNTLQQGNETDVVAVDRIGDQNQHEYMDVPQSDKPNSFKTLWSYLKHSLNGTSESVSKQCSALDSEKDREPVFPTSLETFDRVIPKLKVVGPLVDPLCQGKDSYSSKPWMSPRSIFSPKKFEVLSDKDLVREPRPALVRSRSVGGYRLATESHIHSPKNVNFKRTNMNSIDMQRNDSFANEFNGNIMLKTKDGKPFVLDVGPSSPVLPTATDRKYMLNSLDLASDICATGEDLERNDDYECVWTAHEDAKRPLSAGVKLGSFERKVMQPDKHLKPIPLAPYSPTKKMTLWHEDNAELQEQELHLPDIVGKERELNFGFDDWGMPANVSLLWRSEEKLSAVGRFSVETELLSQMRPSLPSVMTPHEFQEARTEMASVMRPTLELMVGQE